MPTRAQIPPDDDPRFDQWVRDVGPMLELPDIHVRPPVAAAVALIAATIGIGAAVAFAMALVVNAVAVFAACLLIGGGVALAVGALAYLVWRAV